jgi:hypothetical protein
MTTLKSQFRGISNLITIDRRASKPLYQQITIRSAAASFAASFVLATLFHRRVSSLASRASHVCPS